MATRDDVARLAGVSPSTVSYVISGRRSISDATKTRVLAAMRDLNYTPNAFAQGLAGARRGILALHFPTSVDGYSSTEFEYVTAAMERARARAITCCSGSNPMTDVMGMESLVAQKLVAGVLLMEVSVSDPRFDVLRRAKIPFASVGRPDDSDDVIYVDNDFAEAGRLAIEASGRIGSPIHHVHQCFANKIRPLAMARQSVPHEPSPNQRRHRICQLLRCPWRITPAVAGKPWTAT